MYCFKVIEIFLHLSYTLFISTQVEASCTQSVHLMSNKHRTFPRLFVKINDDK